LLAAEAALAETTGEVPLRVRNGVYRREKGDVA